MDIKKTENGNSITYALTGRLEVISAPQFEAAIKEMPATMMEVIFDFSALEYVSSAGLRVILQTQKMMQMRKGVLKLMGVNDTVKKILDITGFSPLLTFV